MALSPFGRSKTSSFSYEESTCVCVYASGIRARVTLIVQHVISRRPSSSWKIKMTRVLRLKLSHDNLLAVDFFVLFLLAAEFLPRTT
jgi:hypothetical protein